MLPTAVALDADRVARFKREAQVLASLNHPNVAAIYGIEDATETLALVLELVEGPTLADRIAEGPVPVDQAVAIATQIAAALAAAHEHGIVHRDLKPANIKLRPDGAVKVLDFGLAKALGPPEQPDLTASPTLSLAATQAGVILGTAAYMAPEQAKGKPVDKRADIWAFGCVVFEMLTGQRAFPGEDLSDTLASVLKTEPHWDALAADTPPTVRALLRRCLIKDPRQRIADIAAALFALDENIRSVGLQPDAAAQPEAARDAHARKRRLALATTSALMLGAATAGTAVWFATRPAPPRVSRLAITTTPATALTINGVDRDLAITPDGSRVIYVGNNGRELFVRPLRPDALRRAQRHRLARRALAGLRGERFGSTRDLRSAAPGGEQRALAGVDRWRDAAAVVTQRAGVVLRVAGRRDHARRRGTGCIVGGDNSGDGRQGGIRDSSDRLCRPDLRPLA